MVKNRRHSQNHRKNNFSLVLTDHWPTDNCKNMTNDQQSFSLWLAAISLCHWVETVIRRTPISQPFVVRSVHQDYKSVHLKAQDYKSVGTRSLQPVCLISKVRVEPGRAG
jgi:hypothetical protein